MRIAYEFGRDKLIRHSASLKLAAASRKYVAYPSALSPIGKRDQKSFLAPKYIDGSPIEFS